MTMKSILSHETRGIIAHTVKSAVVLLLVVTALVGVVYVGAVTGIAQVFFPHQANGSVIEVDGKRYGSELLAQQFSEADHMWGRIMKVNTELITDAQGNPTLWATPSNMSPASDEYAQVVAQRVALIHEAHPDQQNTSIPSDLVTCSGSGLDPDISPAAAEYQVRRLAANTGRSESEVRSIISACTTQPFLGVLGDARVNVLKVNLTLDGVL
ncbi:MAG: potassium-transporting ATPase subunit C [Raoultibacter sp.]